MKTKWTKTWPNKPGRYWFYGWKYPHQPKDDPKLFLVEVIISGNKKSVYIIEGNFMYKDEGSEGLWSVFECPELPKL